MFNQTYTISHDSNLAVTNLLSLHHSIWRNMLYAIPVVQRTYPGRWEVCLIWLHCTPTRPLLYLYQVQRKSILSTALFMYPPPTWVETKNKMCFNCKPSVFCNWKGIWHVTSHWLVLQRLILLGFNSPVMIDEIKEFTKPSYSELTLYKYHSRIYN